MSRRNLHNRIILLNIDSHIHNISTEIREWMPKIYAIIF
jgi:hypothetical protein